MDNPEEITTWNYRRMSVLGLATSGVLHGAVAFALIPYVLPVHSRLSERAIEISVELPAAPPAVAAAQPMFTPQPAAHRCRRRAGTAAAGARSRLDPSFDRAAAGGAGARVRDQLAVARFDAEARAGVAAGDPGAAACYRS